MSNTTNILLVVVIVLLLAVVLGDSKDKNVYANGAASSSPIIFSVDAENKNAYLINIDKSIMLHYRISKGFQLKGARRFDYDVQLINPLDESSGKSYAEIRKIVSKQK